MATSTAPIARPLLKYVGGKTALLPELLKRVPRKFGAYYEPFLGGGALFFRLQPVVAHLSDSNAALISMYTAIRQAPGLVIERLRVLEKDHARWPAQTFARERKVVVGPMEDGLDRWIQQAAGFIYINRVGFNGLWRVNKAGLCNVPMGRYAKPRICDPEGIMAASAALKGCSLRPCTFAEAMQGSPKGAIHPPERGDFVYFDPPYDPVSKTASFRSYTSDGFDRDKQRELADLARSLVARGVKVMLSNSNTPFIRKLYRDKVWQVERVMAPRSINSNGAKRGKVAEVIVTGGYRRHW